MASRASHSRKPTLTTHPPEIGLYAILHHSPFDYIIKFTDEFPNSLLSFPSSSPSEVRIINLGDTHPEPVPGRYLVIYVGNRCFEVLVVKRCVEFSVGGREGEGECDITDGYWDEFAPLVVPMQRTRGRSKIRRRPPTPPLEPLDIPPSNQTFQYDEDESDWEEGEVTKAIRLTPHSPTLVCLPIPPDDTKELPQIVSGAFDSCYPAPSAFFTKDANTPAALIKSEPQALKISVSLAPPTPPTDAPHLLLLPPSLPPISNHIPQNTASAFLKPPPIPPRSKTRLPPPPSQLPTSTETETDIGTQEKETPIASSSFGLGFGFGFGKPPPRPARSTSRIPVRVRTPPSSLADQEIEHFTPPKSVVEPTSDSTPASLLLSTSPTSPPIPPIFKRDKKWRKPVPNFSDELDEPPGLPPQTDETTSQITHSDESTVIPDEHSSSSVVDLVKPMFELEVDPAQSFMETAGEDEENLTRVFSRGSNQTTSPSPGVKESLDIKRKTFWDRFRRDKRSRNFKRDGIFEEERVSLREQFRRDVEVKT